MILFVFEGEKREITLFKALEELYFKNDGDERIICSFCNNIYRLYRRIFETGEDIVSVVKSQLSSSDKINWSKFKVSDFSQVFLFFDYDCHDLSASDDKLKEMLDFFDNETENGKLYISYPMVEAIRYTKELPDKNFYSYTVPISNCRDFKDLANQFSSYRSLDFISFRAMKKSGMLQIPNEQKLEKVRRNWSLLKEQHLAKANYICMGENEMPKNKIDVSQSNIFKSQIEKYIVPAKSVAILCAFPLFLYDYFKL